jgi:hypothetical protein
MASTFSSWAEIAIFSLAFVAVLTIVIGEFNVAYNQSNIVPFSDSNGVTSSIIKYNNDSQSMIQSGEVTYLPYQGMTLKNSFGLIKDGLNIIWNFISGNWIRQVGIALNLGESMMVLLTYLQMLFILGLIFFIIYIIFKVMP